MACAREWYEIATGPPIRSQPLPDVLLPSIGPVSSVQGRPAVVAGGVCAVNEYPYSLFVWRAVGRVLEVSHEVFFDQGPSRFLRPLRLVFPSNLVPGVSLFVSSTPSTLVITACTTAPPTVHWIRLPTSSLWSGGFTPVWNESYAARPVTSASSTHATAWAWINSHTAFIGTERGTLHMLRSAPWCTEEITEVDIVDGSLVKRLLGLRGGGGKHPILAMESGRVGDHDIVVTLSAGGTLRKWMSGMISCVWSVDVTPEEPIWWEKAFVRLSTVERGVVVVVLSSTERTELHTWDLHDGQVGATDPVLVLPHPAHADLVDMCCLPGGSSRRDVFHLLWHTPMGHTITALMLPHAHEVAVGCAADDQELWATEDEHAVQHLLLSGRLTKAMLAKALDLESASELEGHDLEALEREHGLDLLDRCREAWAGEATPFGLSPLPGQNTGSSVVITQGTVFLVLPFNHPVPMATAPARALHACTRMAPESPDFVRRFREQFALLGTQIDPVISLYMEAAARVRVEPMVATASVAPSSGPLRPTPLMEAFLAEAVRLSTSVSLEHLQELRSVLSYADGLLHLNLPSSIRSKVLPHLTCLIRRFSTVNRVASVGALQSYFGTRLGEIVARTAEQDAHGSLACLLRCAAACALDFVTFDPENESCTLVLCAHLAWQGHFHELRDIIDGLESRTPFLLFVLGQCHLALGDHEEAVNVFLQAAPSALRDPILRPAAGPLQPATTIQAAREVLSLPQMPILGDDRDNDSDAALLPFYTSCMKLLEHASHPEGVLCIARAALASLHSHSRHRATLWSDIFYQYLVLERYEEAYQALVANEDPQRQDDCLRHFVIVLCERDRVEILCEQLPFAGMIEKVVDTLHWRARNADVSRAARFYDILYAFHVHHDNFRQAAHVMFELAERLAEEAHTHDIHSLERQYTCLVAALNCFHLIDPAHAWVLRPPSNTNGQRKRKVDAPEGESQERTRLVITLEQIEKQTSLVHARLMLRQRPNEASDLIPTLSERDTVPLLLEAGFYDEAISLSLCFSLDLWPILHHLVHRCLESEGAYGETDKWLFLQNMLERYDTTKTAYELRVRVAKEILRVDPQNYLPRWLTNPLKVNNPNALLRLYLGHNLMDEANWFMKPLLEGEEQMPYISPHLIEMYKQRRNE